MLGLTPLPVGPFMLGSIAPLTFWAFFYASLGGASRSLWARGVALDVLLADLVDRAAALSGDAGRATLTLGLLGGGVLLVSSVRRGRRLRRAQAGALEAPEEDLAPLSQERLADPAARAERDSVAPRR